MNNNVIIILALIVTIMLYLQYNHKINEPYESKNININNNGGTSIMAIFKNEELYLEEWLQHHIKEGIDHFYLYSNDTNMKKYEYLDKYMDKITLIPWIDIKPSIYSTVQRDAYTHCIKNYNNKYDYLLMLDIDEFLVSLLDNKRVIDIINKLDKNKTKTVKIQRYNFGSDGHIKKPLGNIVNNYKKHEKICSSYKALANSKFLDVNSNYYGVHDHPYNDVDGIIYNSYLKYDEDYDNESYIGPNRCDKNSINEIPLVINHYYTKSQEEYMERCKLWVNGGINNIGYRDNCEENFKEKDVKDITGYKYIKYSNWYKYDN